MEPTPTRCARCRRPEKLPGTYDETPRYWCSCATAERRPPRDGEEPCWGEGDAIGCAFMRWHPGPCALPGMLTIAEKMLAEPIATRAAVAEKQALHVSSNGRGRWRWAFADESALVREGDEWTVEPPPVPERAP